MTSSKIITSSTVVLAFCGVLVTATLVRSEFFPPVNPPPPVRSSIKPTTVNDWDRFFSDGTRFGPAGATIMITEFSDFQCPYCKRLSETLQKVADAYPLQVAFSFRHSPIDRIHPFARDAARAAECAASQGRFKEMHDVLYQKQDSIGKVSFVELARRAGINDSVGLATCMAGSAVALRITKDEEAARKLEIRGTPLLLINDLKFAGAPPYAVVDSVIRALLKAANDSAARRASK